MLDSRFESDRAIEQLTTAPTIQPVALPHVGPPETRQPVLVHPAI
jgi:hypothetical protein